MKPPYADEYLEPYSRFFVNNRPSPSEIMKSIHIILSTNISDENKNLQEKDKVILDL